MAEVKGIVVSTVFGERFWIEPVPEVPSEDWQRWSMFALTADGTEAQPPPSRLVLLAATPQLQESAPVEEVVLIRDETANMVRGVRVHLHMSFGVRLHV